MMPARLILSSRDLARIEAEARTAWPREACGLLIGHGEAEGALTVTLIVPACNVASDDERFEIDPALLLQTHRELRGTPKRIIGHYHSHPNGKAEPSARDRSASFEPGLAWLILALSSKGPAIPAVFLHPPAQIPLAAFETMALDVTAP